MKTIGLVTFRKLPKLTPSDQLLVEPLARVGFKAVAVPWDDPRIDWKQFDMLILRSCWNYHLHYDQFLRWLSSVEKLGVQVWNPVATVQWNTDKKYLLDLEKKGIPVVPTVIVNRQDTANLESIMTERGWQDIVMKPSVGASAQYVYRAAFSSVRKAQKICMGMPAHADILIQPLMKEVMETGEYSLVFIGGQHSHTVLKIPKKGDFRANYDLGATEKKVQSDPVTIRQASRILEALHKPILYARVDGILVNGSFTLMELELTEPHLFFDFDPASPQRFAGAVSLFTTA